MQSTLDNLKGQRRDNFTTNVAWGGTDGWCYSYTPSKNFIYLTPELGQYLHDNALSKVQNALNEYYHNTAYWLTPGFEDAYSENIFSPYYDNNIFLAKAYILKEPREELVKYLDTPMFKAGDLFYIQNLVAAIEAPTSGTTPTPTPLPDPNNLDGVGGVDLADIILLIQYIFNSSGTYIVPGADPNVDGSWGVNLLDVIALISVVFSS